MATVVAAFGVGHTSQIVRSRHLADTAKTARIDAAFAKLRQRLVDVEATALVVVSSEHFKTFFFDNFPTFCIGVGTRSVGWGDGGLPEYELRVAQPLADDALSGVVERGFDVSFAANMRLDHGFMTPLHFLRPEADLPVIPIFQNCTTAPLPTIGRCAAFGRALGDSFLASEADHRIAVVGTGGLSHWVGVPGMGRVNEKFDREVLQMFERGDKDEILQLSTERIEQEAGNGGQELRNWVTAWAALPRGGADVLCYEAVPEWCSGLGFVEFTPGEAA